MTSMHRLPSNASNARSDFSNTAPHAEHRELFSAASHSTHSDDTSSLLSAQRGNDLNRETQNNLTSKNVDKSAVSPSVWDSVQAMDWWWWWEIGASALSIACVAAIVGVLVFLNNLAIDQWNFQISPNSLIAVMTTISKAAMMVPIAACISQLKWVYFSGKTRPIRNLDLFDAASRGPWGSLCFIPSIRTEAITASALALVTILALGVEPTAQQILGLSSRLHGGQDHGNSVYIPLASSYSSKMADFEGISDTVGEPYIQYPDGDN
jgi:hypothetical protein